MSFLTTLLQFFQGAGVKFGTSSNLLREVLVSVLTAVAVAVLVQFLNPPPPSPISEVRDLLATQLAAQHRTDSIMALTRQWALQGRIDSLHLVILSLHEKDSLRANAGLSDLDAMRKINSAVAADRKRTQP